MRLTVAFGLLMCMCIGAAAVLLTGADAKVLSRAEIVQELVNNKFSRTFLSHWVCLVENESGGDTKKVVSNNGGVSYQYGIFQIDSKDGCGKGYVGGICQVKCEDLLTDKMDAANIKCANKYFDRHGFKGWTKWMSSCKQKPLPNIQPYIRAP